jgi:hypothetical protein
MWEPKGDYSGNGRTILDGLILSAPAIAIDLTIPSASESWHFGGYIDQQISTEIGLANISAGKVYLRQITILRMPAMGDYSLVYNPAKWLDDWVITIHQYIGENIFYGS